MVDECCNGADCWIIDYDTTGDGTTKSKFLIDVARWTEINLSQFSSTLQSENG